MSQPSYLPHYTYGDYCQWTGDWGLYHGIPIAMTPSPFGRHQQLITRLARLIGNELASRTTELEVLVELDWVVDDDTVVRPDLVVIEESVPEGHLEQPPVLAVEVISNSSRDRDSSFKRELYQQQGVAHYLLVDPDEMSIRHLAFRQNTDITRTATDDHLSMAVTSEIKIKLDLKSLFK